MTKKSAGTDAIVKELRAWGLTYPGAHTKSPWPGHLDLAVNDKTFAYLSIEGEPFSIGCKLPQSAAMALMLPGTSPTPYGLGKSGWVTAQFPDGRVPPIDVLKAWIDESYRAQAPKKLIASIGVDGAGMTNAKTVAKKPAVKKAAVKKAAVKRAAKRPVPKSTARKR
ncbi:MAG: DifB protein [Myxococcales bacterium]|nr:DifB protein [Myxococcales bacterium]